MIFDVFGKPAPQGSKRAYYNVTIGRAQIVDANPKTLLPWREAVKLAALEVLIKQGQGFGRAPVIVGMDFYLARPKAHYRTGKHANELRLDAPQRPTTKPDADKLIRSTLDSLTDAGAYADDSCAVEVHAAKWYADDRPPGARIAVEALP